MSSTKHQINSHIQIPESFMARFSHEGSYDTFFNGEKHQNKKKFIWFFDIKRKKYGEVLIDEYYTKIGYYSDEIEHILSKEIESPINALATRVRKNYKSGKEQFLSDSEIKCLNKLIFTSIARADNIVQKLSNYLPNNVSPNKIVDYTNNYLDYQQHFNDIDIIYNETKTDFVIPTCCIITTKQGVIIPLFKNIAIRIRTNVFSKSKLSVVTYKNDKDIENINMAAFDNERSNRQIILFKTEEQLLTMARSIGIYVNKETYN